MRSLQRIALVLVIIGAINWGLIGLFQFDLVASIFGGQGSGLARFIYTLVGVSGLLSLTMLFEPDRVDDTEVEAEEDNRRVLATPNLGTEFAEEPDLDKLYNPSREVYEDGEEEE